MVWGSIGALKCLWSYACIIKSLTKFFGRYLQETDQRKSLMVGLETLFNCKDVSEAAAAN